MARFAGLQGNRSWPSTKKCRHNEQYTAAVAYGAIEADQGTALAHQQRAARIVELKRNYGLK